MLGIIMYASLVIINIFSSDQCQSSILLTVNLVFRYRSRNKNLSHEVQVINYILQLFAYHVWNNNINIICS